MTSSSVGVVLSVLLLLSVVLCKDVFVDIGADAGGDGTALHPYTSLSEAITNEVVSAYTSPGIQIILSPGTYEGTENTNITLDSLFVQITGVEASSCIVTGSTDPNSFAFAVSGIGSLTITNIKFQNLKYAIKYYSTDHKNTNQHPISISSCIFDSIQENTIQIQGQNTLEISDVSFTNCHGSIITLTGNGNAGATVTISDVSVSASGGIYLENISGDLQGISFREMGQRAVFWNPKSGSRNSIKDCSFMPPLASLFQGAALYIQQTGGVSSTMLIRNNSFTGANAGQGGAVWIGNIDASIEDCSFVDCSANNGGAIIVSSATLNIEDCTFSDNSAVFGGAIYLQQESTVQLINNTFSDNVAITGSTIYCNSNEDLLVIARSSSEFQDSECNIIAASSFTSAIWDTTEYSSYSESDSLYYYIFFGTFGVGALLVVLLLLGALAGAYFIKKKNKNQYDPDDEPFEIDLEELS